ncbi:ferritin-like protein [Nitrospirillum sp. BR 11163]|uniref:ferritin-like domain-containing protein n=1 Tax=Nitrospirillum sp. BR 11163 TaxID=3104323 RepID=UPI002AFDF029|nr:ferritin-like protein [Nitrospirillum sp. BR 11163]MEA1675984.1 ferritin-like protein [Nitrospirillum sp. BR 11163]
MSTSATPVVTIRTDILNRVKAATCADDLYPFLQSAVELEHATIPAYLTALYSIKLGTNTAVAQIIHSIVVEEMLHMTIAANVLNAIGGQPSINHPGFIPKYPGPLPMSVDDGLIVPLAPVSLDLVQNVFMRIELPETPRHYPSFALGYAQRGYATIGEFYDAIIERILFLGPSIFTGDPARQVVDNTWFPPNQLFPITDVESAVRGLNVIKRQGEGTPDDPLESDGQPAHYYRFEEIVRGRRLVKDDRVPEGYSFTGDAVPFHPEGVINLVRNSKLADYQKGSLAYAGVEQANYTYTSLLNALHTTFNGQPGTLRASLGLMFELRLVVLEKVVNQLVIDPDAPHYGQFAAPAFQFAAPAATADFVAVPVVTAETALVPS